MHVAPSEGTPRDVAGPVIDMLFPQGAHFARADRGDHGHERQDHDGAHAGAHHEDGAATRRASRRRTACYIDGQRTVQGDMTGPMSAQMVLADPQIDIAVLETARGGLLRAGMGVREVNVGAVLNVQSDHLGLKGIDTLEQLAEVKRVVIEVATDCAVLNADDPLVLKMSGYTEAKNICYVTMNPQHALVREHIRAGGRACALEAGVNGQMITLYDRGSHIPLLWTHLIPATLEGRATHNVQNAMFAAAMAFSLGNQARCDPPGAAHVRHDVLPGAGPHERLQRASVQGRVRLRPQRARRRHHGGSGAASRRHRPPHRRAGRAGRSSRRRPARDREGGGGTVRPLHLSVATTTCATAMADEVPRIIAKALMAEGVAKDAISIIPDEQEAIDAALSMGQAGDLLLIFADALTRSWKQITKFRPAGMRKRRLASHRPRRKLVARRGSRRAAAAVEPRRSVARRTRHSPRAGGRRLNESGRIAVRQLAAPDGQQPVLRLDRRRTGNDRGRGR